MGNLTMKEQQKSYSTLKEGFKTFQKEGLQGGAQPTLSTQFLVGEEKALVEGLASYLFKVMGVEVKNEDVAHLVSSNVQKNAEVEDQNLAHSQKALAEANARFVAGFKNPESNVEDLGHPDYEKHFTVLADQAEQEEYHAIHVEKMKILYGLYVFKQRSSSDDLKTFSDYAKQFFKDTESETDSEDFGHQTGIGFMVGLLRELKTTNDGSLLTRTLEHLLEALCKVKPGAFDKSSKFAFERNNLLNKARDFLLELINDSSTDKSITSLAYRIILMLGLARNSVQDLLVLCQLLDQNSQVDVDLRKELRMLRDSGHASTKEFNAGKIKFVSEKFSEMPLCSYGDASLGVELTSDSWILDGDHLFAKVSGRGLLKICTGTCGQPPGTVRAVNKELDGDKASMMLLGGKLYMRHEGIKPAGFMIIDKETLQEIKQEPELNFDPKEGQTQSLKWVEKDEKTGRSLEYTPLITDGTNIYVIAKQKDPKSEEQKDADDEEDVAPKLVLEVYDLEYKFVREVTLCKKNKATPFKKSDNSDDWMRKTKWATNGQAIACFTSDRKVRFFSIETGLYLAKKKYEDYEENDFIMCDPATNQFAVIKKTDDLLQYRKFTFENFKATGSQCAQPEGLQKLQSKFLEQTSPQEEEKLGDIEQMLFNEAYAEPKQAAGAPWPTGIQAPQIAGLTRSLILQYLCGQVGNFALHLEAAEQGIKNASSVMSIFRFPLVTHLAANTFVTLGKALKSGAGLFEKDLGENNICELQSLLSLLEVVNANFRALNFCSINLATILSANSDYKRFMNSFRQCVEPLAQEGATSKSDKSGDKTKIREKYDAAAPEAQRLFRRLFSVAGSIMESSITLLHKGPVDMLVSINKTLNADQGSSCRVQIAHLAQIEQLRVLMQVKKAEGEQEEESRLPEVIEAFGKIASLDSALLKDKLKSYDIDKIKDLKTEENSQEQALIDASQSFISGFSEEIALKYAAKCTRMPGKKSAKYEAANKALQTLEEAAVSVVTVTCSQLKEQFDIVMDTLEKSCEAKKGVDKKEEDKTEEEKVDKWEGFEEKYKKYSSLVAQALGRQAAFRAVFLLYAQTFSILRPQSKTLIAKIVKGALDLIRSMSRLYKLWKAYGAKLGLGEAITGHDAKTKVFDKLEDLIGGFRRQLNWYVGHVAHELIRVEKKPEKKEEEEKKEGEDEQKAKEKAQREKRRKAVLEMVLQSNLLSGGIEPCHLTIFSTEMKHELLNYARLIGDRVTVASLEQNEGASAQAGEPQKKLSAIITSGKDEEVDLVIKLLQKIYVKQNMAVASLGGARGMTLSRAAFAIMIKFSDLTDDFLRMVDDLAMEAECADDDAGKEKSLIQSLEKLKGADLMIKRWQSAARMRAWIGEKKLTLCERYEKQVEAEFRKKKGAAEEEKKKEDEKKEEEKKDAPKTDDKKDDKKVEKAPEEESKQIDSTTKPKDEEKKDEEEKTEEKKAEDKELTAEDLDKIRDQAFDMMEKDFEVLVPKIVAKAEFLIKLNIPQGFKHEDPVSKEVGSLLVLKRPTKLKGLPPPKLDWEGRLKAWKLMQTTKGAIKSTGEVKSEVWSSGITSILALLQTAVEIEPILKQVEGFQISSFKRATGLKLLRDLMAVEMPRQQLYDLLSWFSSSLRANKNTLTHYLDDTMVGQGTHIETLARSSFFGIYGTLVQLLKTSKEDKEIKLVLNALKWKFSGRDHGELAQLKVFAALHKGDGEKDNKLKKAWGRQVLPECQSIDDQSLAKDVLEMFEHLFLAASGRLTASDEGETLSLKSASGNSKSLQRAKSLLNQSQSEILLGQAFEIIFKELERYLSMLDGYKGMDWSVYVQMRNQERKKGDEVKKLENSDDLLLDEIEVEKEDDAEKKDDQEEKKKEEEKKEEETKKEEKKEEVKEEAKEEVKKEEEQIPSSSTTPATLPDNTCGVCTFINESDAFECTMCGSELVPPSLSTDAPAEKKADSKEDAEESDHGNEEEQKNMKEYAEKRKALEEREFKNLGQLYSEPFLKRLLRLVEIFTSAAKCSSHPLSMVQRIANPYHISTLFHALLTASPSIKILILKILQNIIFINIPHEVFEEAVSIISRDEKAVGHSLLHKVKSTTQFEGSIFVKFLFNYLLSLRQKMWSLSEAESEGQYAVSQLVAETLRIISSITGYKKDSTQPKGETWNKVMTENMTKSLLKLEDLPLDEADALFSILGGEYGRLTAGQKAITRDMEIVTILGYSSTWKLSETIFKDAKEKDDFDKVLKQLRILPEFTEEAQMAVGLFYDKNQKERQDLMLLNPSTLTPILSVDPEEDSNMAEKSPLMDAALVKHLITILQKSEEEIKELPASKQVAIAQNQSYILKVFQNQITLMGQKFLDHLKKENCLQALVGYLYQDIGKISGRKDKADEKIIPLKWLEARIYNMRKLAIETKRSLSYQTEEIQVFMVNKKELLFKRVDLVSKVTSRCNALITSAINIHTVVDDTVFSGCHAKEIGVESATTTAGMKNQLVFMDIADLKALDARALTILNTSDAIVTAQPSDLDVNQLFKEIFAVYMADQEKSPASKYENILTPAIFFVSEDHFQRCTRPAVSFKTGPSKPSTSPIERLLDELHEWGGLDREKLLFNLQKDNLDDLPAVMQKMEEGLTQLLESDEKYKEKKADLKSNSEDASLAKLEEKEAEKKALRAKTAQEIGELLKVAKKGEDKAEKENSDSVDKITEVEVFEDYQKEDKWWKEIQDVVTKKVAAKGSSKETVEKVDEKGEAKMNKQLFSAMTGYDAGNLRQEHALSITQSLHQQRQTCLFELIASSSVTDKDGLLATLMDTPEAQTRLAQFLKLNFNSTICEMLQNKQKKGYQTMKQKLRDIFEFSRKSEHLKGFVKSFLVKHILQAGVKSAKDCREKKTKKVPDYFESEGNALSGLNPYILRFFTNYFLKENYSELLEVKNTLPTLMNLLLCSVIQFQENKSLVNKLLKCCLRLVTFARKNCGPLAKSGQLAPMIQNKLVKLATETIDFKDESTESDAKWLTNQQLIFLEIHLLLNDIAEQVQRVHKIKVDQILVDSEAICSLNMTKQILRENDRFDSGKYLYHLDQLEDHQKELMNITIDSNHPAFDVMTRAFISLPEVKRLKIRFKDSMKLKDLAQIGFSNDSRSDIVLKNQNSKEFDWQSGSFYVFYPIQQQSLIGFGVNEGERLGDKNLSFAQPAVSAPEAADNFRPVQVYGAGQHSAVLTSAGDLYETGTCGPLDEKKLGSLTKSAFKDKVRLVALSDMTVHVVLEDNSIWYRGFSLENHLPKNEDKDSFTELKIWKDQTEAEKITQLTSGAGYTLAVTEAGNLWAWGELFLGAIDFRSQVPLKIALPEGMLCRRAWSTSQPNQVVVFLELEGKDGKKQIYSCGKSKEGLLGQGPKVSEAKTFKKIVYETEDLEFVDLSVGDNFAVATDSKGKLWGWGVNKNHALGLSEVDDLGIQKPTALEKLNNLGMKAKKVSCGQTHTLVLFEDQAQEKEYLYSVGLTKGADFAHLGAPEDASKDPEKPFREIKQFSDKKLVGLLAHDLASFVIIEGRKEICDALYAHTLPDKQEVHGLLHFYKTKEGAWKFVSQDEYPTKKGELPDLCFAIKCPINDIAGKEWPDLDKLAAEVIDTSADSTEVVHTGYKCSKSGAVVKGPLYHSCCIVNHGEVESNFGEETIHADTEQSINPQIFIRVAKKMKTDAKLPTFSLEKFYKPESRAGVDIEIVPDLRFKKNHRFIKMTKQAWDEIQENDSKFKPEFKASLLAQIDKQVSLLIKDKEIKDIKIETDLKISDFEFDETKDKGLKKLNEKALKQKVMLYWMLNTQFFKILPYNTKLLQPIPGSAYHLIQMVKGSLLGCMKTKFIDKEIEALPTGSSQSLTINRLKAQRFKDKGKCDHTGEHTIFGQMYQWFQKDATKKECFRQNQTDDKAFNAKFAGEASIDDGGPYRETLTNLVVEIESEYLPLMVKTANNRNVIGFNRNCLLPNPQSITPTHAGMFQFFGNLMGLAIRAKSAMDFNLPPYVWKQLLGEPATFADLEGTDSYSFVILQGIQAAGKTGDPKIFAEKVPDETFTTYLSGGELVELCTGGKEKKVTLDNYEEFVNLVTKAKLGQTDKQMAWIKEGINFVVDLNLLTFLTWEELEIRACGPKDIDLEVLKKLTSYNVDKEHPQIVMFWEVMGEFTQAELKSYLKFVWGRTKIPVDTSDLRYSHQVNVYPSEEKDSLPRTHTCYFTIDLPVYSNKETMKKRISTAFEWCGEIDDDAHYMGGNIPQEYGDEGGDDY